MRPSAILASTLAAVGAYAAPALPRLNLTGLANPAHALDAVSDYFGSIAIKVQTARVWPVAPVCDLSKAQMPLNGLPAPSAGLTVRHVAIGRGTQNYTCDAYNSSALPQAAGAVATLFNVSCIAATAPDLLEKMPGMAVNFDLQQQQRQRQQLGPAALAVSGVHYFLDSTTPFFDLDTASADVGEAACAKSDSVQAPAAAAAVGQRGEAAVAWLRLAAKEGAATGGIKEVYRVDTAGGSAPATCEGMPAEFEVQYSAVYWFWQEQ